MKLKNYLIQSLLFIFSITSLNAQKNNNKNTQNNINKGVLAPDTNFVPRIFDEAGLNVGNIRVKGDVTLVGNTIIGKVNTNPVFSGSNPIPTNLATLTAEANTPYSGTGRNNDFKFEYIDIDTDPSTFSSSSADLIFKNLDGTSAICTKVAYAGLYWAASYAFTRSTDPNKNNVGTPPSDDWNKVKFKIPGSTNYVDITVDKNNANLDAIGQEDQVIIRDNDGITGTPEPTIGYPYVCYKNVTNLIKTLGVNAGGTYTVANMRAGLGDNRNGLCAGWTLVIVFENNSFPSKYITVFDGFKYLQATPTGNLKFDISGFKTVPFPFPVRVKLGVVGLEGENGTGDALKFISPATTAPSPPYTALGNILNPTDNFFNSTISVPSTTTPFSVNNTARNPASTNTLGLDIDIIDVQNGLVANDATSASIFFPGTDSDSYSSHLFTFAADIIEPNIILTKIVKAKRGPGSVLTVIPTLPTAVPFYSNEVFLGEDLTYEITYQNIGNDSAVNFTLKDVLPEFVTFLSATANNGETILPITPTLNSAGTLTFSIPNSNGLKNTPLKYTITINVRVTSDPNIFVIACRNVIKNTATASYFGASDTSATPLEYNDGSYAVADICGNQVTSTNIVAGINAVVADKIATICGTEIELIAPDNYLSYTWTNLSTGVVSTGQKIVVPISAIPGPPLPLEQQFVMYNVFCDIGSPCYPINVKYKVSILANSNIQNPVDPFADEIRNWDNDNDNNTPNPTPLINPCVTPQPTSMPIIYLCGNETKLINPDIQDSTFLWEKLNDSREICVNKSINCSLQDDENPTTPICAWSTVGTGKTFLADTAGEYRITVTFTNNCVRVFNFKVFKSSQTIDATVRNISCEVKGQIVVTGIPANGYEYKITGRDWQAFTVFDDVAQGSYDVCARLISTANTPGSCEYCINKYVDNTTASFTVAAQAVQPLCKGDTGSINVQVGGANPQYIYTIRLGSITGPIVGSSPPTNDVTKTFGPYAPACYFVTGSNQDGCTKTIEVCLVDPDDLKISANLTKPVTCEPGELTVTPVGGTGPYVITVDGGPIGLVTLDVTNTFSIPVPNPNTGAVQNLEFPIKIVDFNNCEYSELFTTQSHPEPEITAAQTNIYCYGNNSGEIRFTTVSNLGNYILSYSIDDGVTYSSSNLFTGLSAKIYKIKVKYSYPTLGNVDCIKTLPDINIIEPEFGLSAAAGVSELACDSLGGKGKVRITNPQGGTPFTTGSPYIYYFPPNSPPVLPNPFTGTFSTAGSQTSNEALLSPGLNQEVWIQDASGCSFPMTVSIDPLPTPATITPGPITYKCDGTGSQTYVVNSNGGNFSYEYFLDNSTTPNSGPTPNVFENLPCGQHEVRVEYTAINIPTYNNLLIETFGSGPNVKSPGINPGYCFERQIPGFECKGNLIIQDGDYAVTNKIDPTYVGLWTAAALDHTVPGSGTGRFLCVNIGGIAGIGGILYSKPIRDIVPNQPIKVSLWYMNLLILTNQQLNPNLTLQLVKDLGLPTEELIATGETGDIPKTEAWLNKIIELNPKANTNLFFVIRSNIDQTSGNDVIIDDINVYQEPKQCTVYKSFIVNIECGKAFTAQVTGFSDVSCANGTNGTVTITAQNYDTVNGWQYSTNNGVTWSALITTPSVKIENFPIGTATILVRYDDSPLPCTQTLTQPIGLVPVLVASATAIQATCLVKASINASATTGGTPGVLGYTYTLLNSPALTAVAGFPPQQNNSLFINVPAGTYIVQVEDSNKCIDDTNTRITIDELPVLKADISSDSDLCYDPINQAKIIVTPTGGSGVISYAIANSAGGPFIFTPSATFSGLAPGTYYIKVIDEKDCVVDLGPIVIAPQLLLTASLVRDISCKAPPANNAQIVATAVGGLAPLTFQISLDGGTTYANATGLSGATIVGNTLTYETVTQGTVKIRVSDANIIPCTSESTIFTITEPVKPTGTATATQASCGLKNGTVTLTATSGATPFTYSFDGIAPSLTVLYTGLGVGTYPWKIIDDKGCETSGTVEVTEPDPISGTLQIKTNYTCLGTACIEVINTAGGTPATAAPFYTYSIGGNFQASNEFCNLTDGSYTVTIKDSKECTFVTKPIVIEPLIKPTDLTFINSNADCQTQTASVTVGVVGGSPTFTYSITNPVSLIANTAVGATFNNLPAATPIIFKVVDSKGCEFSETYNFAPITPITVKGSSTNVKCFDEPTGTYRFEVSNFATGFTYTITSNNAVPPKTGSGTILSAVIDVTGLPNGAYTIVVKDNDSNCTAEWTVTIINPPAKLELTIKVTPKTCFVGGSVDLSIKGGFGSNTFKLTEPDGLTLTNAPFSNLTKVGFYKVCVKDGNDCEVCEDFEIKDAEKPKLNLANTDFCFDGADKATIRVTASAGSGTGYEYFILPITASSAPNPTGNVFPNLLPNTYNIVVRDSAGCISDPLEVIINPQLTVGVTLKKDLDCSATNPNAEYTIKVADGYPNYGYQVQFGTGSFLPAIPTPIVGSSFDFIASNGSGTYTIKITDSKGCTAETIIKVNPLIPVTATSTQVDVKCKGDNTGSFTIIPSGGVAGTLGYLVQLNGTGSFLPNNFTHSGLVAGVYTYIVKDSKGCTFSGSVTINDLFEFIVGEPVVTQLTIPSGNCAGLYTPNGKICIPLITGGLAGYTISMSGSQGVSYNNISSPTGIASATNLQCYDNLDIGDYLIIITDANNCSKSYNITIAGPVTDLKIDPSLFPPTDCISGGCIKLTASGTLLSTTKNLWFALVQSNPPPLYFVGSPFFQPATNPGLLPTGDPLRNESLFCNLTPGKIYKFIVYSEANECYFPATATVPVRQFSPLSSTTTPNSVTCLNEKDGSVNFTFSNYSSNSITYQIFRQVDDVAVGLPVPINTLTPGGPTQSVNNFGVLTPGLCYYILFTENGGPFGGCKTASPIFCINQAPTQLTLINVKEIKKDACDKNIGVASAEGNGGAGGYSYQIVKASDVVPTNIPVNNPAYLAFLNAFTIPSTFGGLTGSTTLGNYVIYVKDKNNCVVSQPVSIGIEPELILDKLTVNQCDNVSNYTIKANATGGFGTKTYSSLTATPSPNTDGIFNFPIQSVTTDVTITVTDVNGCTDSEIIKIYPKLNISLSDIIQPSCSTGTNVLANNGSVTANAIGGTGSYTYSISSPSSPATQFGNVFTNLTAGVEYTITVNDIPNACTDVIKITLVAAIPVVISSTSTKPVSCFNGTNGQITINLAASNINGPYTYIFNPDASNGEPARLPGETNNNNFAIFDNIPFGDWIVRVKSSLGCQVDVPVTVKNADEVTLTGVVAPFKCQANNTIGIAVVTLTGSGGTGADYLYSETDLLSSYTPLNNAFTVTDTGVDRDVTYYVRDGNGCKASVTVKVFTAKKITDFEIKQIRAISCSAPESERVEIINVVGGSGDYTYAVNGKANTVAPFNEFDLPTATTYSVRVTDKVTGCFKDKDYVVAPIGIYTVVLDQPAAITCFGGTSSLAFNVNGFSGPFDYQIFESASTTVPVYPATGFASGNSPGAISVPTPFPAGVYTVKVTQSNLPKCSVTSNTVTITAPAVPLTVKLLSNINAFCTSPNAVVTVEGQGGTKSPTGYTYSITQTAVAGTFSIVPTATFTANLDPNVSLTWYAFVKDANGCVSTTPLQITIARDADPTIAIVAPLGNQCDITGLKYIINVLGSGLSTATVPLTYAISTNPTLFTTQTSYEVPFPTTGTTTVFVTVRDKNGCTAKTADIIIYPSLRLIADITKQPFCDVNDGIITVGATGGNGVNVYSITPTATQTPTGFSGLTAGIKYEVKVTNVATGCSDTKELTPAIPTPVTLLPFTKQDIKCFGGNTGSFAVIIAPQTATVNNNPIYTYAIVPPLVTGASPVQVGNTFSGLIAGTYIVEVTSAVNCKERQTIEIEQNTQLVVPPPTVVQASCPPNSNVTSFAQIISPKTGTNAVSGGTPPYQYSFNQVGDPISTPNSNNTFTITTPVSVPTIYILTVQDANGCIVSSTPVTVNPIVRLESFTVDTTKLITCEGTSLQEIKVNVITNPIVTTANLTYTITRVLPVNPPFTISNSTGVFDDINGLPIGNYKITVTNNDTSCILGGPIYYVNNPNTFQAKITNIVDVKCFGDTTGSALVTVVDNIINANDPDNSGIFDCVLIKDGVLTPPYRTIRSTNPDATLLIDNLPAGYYEVNCTLINDPKCPVSTISFTVRQPQDLIINARKATDPTCRNTGNVGEGAIDVTVTGGKRPYLVNVTRTGLTAHNYGNFPPGNIGGLIPGTYSITVTDGSTPPCTKPAVIIELPEVQKISGGILTSNLPGNRLLCYNDKNAIITVSGLVGGQPNVYPYNYTLIGTTINGAVISNGPKTSPDFNVTGIGYGAGTYSILVSDAIGCGIHTVGPITITEPDIITATLSIKRPMDCTGTGDLELSAIGGTGIYYWSTAADGFFTQFPVATPNSVIFIKPVGDYIFYVKDFNGCVSKATSKVTLEAIPELIIKTVKATRVTCVSLSTGTITATAAGGFDTKYVYTLYSSATGAPINPSNVTGQVTGEFTGLPTGDYWVGVTSGGGCVSKLVPINVPPQLNFEVKSTPTNVKCFGEKTGTLTISIIGALGEIEYSITPPTPLLYDRLKLATGTSYLPLTGLAPGTYQLDILDLGKLDGYQNCPVTLNFEITQPTKLNNNETVISSQETCFGDKDGEATINMQIDSVTGTGTGTPPYTVALDGSTTFVPMNKPPYSHTFSGLSGGKHTAVVKDSNDCELIIPINLDPTIPTLPTTEIIYPCPPVNGNETTVSINDLISAEPGYTVSYSLDETEAYQTSPIFTNVSPGIHFIKVKTEITFSTPSPARTNTCITKTDLFTVQLIEPMILKLTDGNLNEIIAITTGGMPPYNYDFNGVNTGTVSTYVISQTDKYTVTVTDTRGCPAKVSKTFNFIDIFIPNFFSPDGDGNNDAWAPQNTFNYKNLVFYVFDRYGRKIGTFNEGEFWDGKYNGEELPSGDYWYLVKPDGAKDGKEYVGNFSLYR